MRDLITDELAKTSGGGNLIDVDRAPLAACVAMSVRTALSWSTQAPKREREEQMIHTIGALHIAMRRKHGDPQEKKPVEVTIKKRRRAPERDTPSRYEASTNGVRA